MWRCGRRKWGFGVESLANGSLCFQANARPSTPVAAKVNRNSKAGEEDEASKDSAIKEGERDNSSAALASVRLPPSSYQRTGSPSLAADVSAPYSPPRRRHRRQISSVAYDGHYIVGDRDRR